MFWCVILWKSYCHFVLDGVSCWPSSPPPRPLSAITVFIPIICQSGVMYHSFSITFFHHISLQHWKSLHGSSSVPLSRHYCLSSSSFLTHLHPRPLLPLTALRHPDFLESHLSRPSSLSSRSRSTISCLSSKTSKGLILLFPHSSSISSFFSCFSSTRHYLLRLKSKSVPPGPRH